MKLAACSTILKEVCRKKMFGNDVKNGDRNVDENG